MRYKVHFPALAFQRVHPDDPMVPVGDPVLVKKGQDVPEWATPATVNALVTSGMVLPIAEDVPYVEPPPPAVANPEVLPQFGGPLTLGGLDTPAGEETFGPAIDELDEDGDSAVVEKPRPGDNKSMWEAYAESIGIPRGEAEALTKADLQKRVDNRETELAAPPA